MTIEKCQAFCDAGSYGFSGVEYGSECYCDYSIQYQGASTTPTVCNVKCGGNINQTCGGAGAISVFSSGKPLPTIPAAVVGTNATSWAYQGCFTDNSIGTRTLALRIAPAAGGVTPQTCVNTCQSAGQSVAGVEFGTECWCGNVVSASATKVADNQCGTACTSNPSFFCGDDNRLNVWKRAV
ncbi:WSC domain-containing protein [Lyophyllum atratum]|nr:WSC domain-containing protein [Lyophyllum atratum]